jgi:hypothetical protein
MKLSLDPEGKGIPPLIAKLEKNLSKLGPIKRL